MVATNSKDGLSESTKYPVGPNHNFSFKHSFNSASCLNVIPLSELPKHLVYNCWFLFHTHDFSNQLLYILHSAWSVLLKVTRKLLVTKYWYTCVMYISLCILKTGVLKVLLAEVISVSPGNLLDMQNLMFLPRPTKSETLRVNPAILC